MQQRYYDPVIGRFYSNDPVGFSASNPMMFNRYAYANNNPYKYMDPNGKAAFLVLLATPEGIALAATTAGAAWYAIKGTIQAMSSEASESDSSEDGEGSDSDNESDGVWGSAGNNKGKKGKDFRGGKKNERDSWGKYSGNKFRDFRKWQEKRKQKDSTVKDLEDSDEADEAYEEFLDDTGRREDEEPENEKGDRSGK